MTANPSFLRTKKANTWIREAKAVPLPAMLFGEFWYEGQLTLMYGVSGSGKTILAVQIAEAIARGRGIEPLEIDSPPRTVMLLDLDHTAKQFEMRYTADPHDAPRGRLTGHYDFSDRFHRVEVDANASVPEEFGSFDQYLSSSLDQLVRETNASVLIVDDLTRLKRSREGTRECLAFMRELIRLKTRYGLSIMVLTDMPRRSTSRSPAVSDLLGEKLLAKLADSAFAVCVSKAGVDQRYLKQIKQHNAPIVYNASHVPAFAIKKIDANFLGFNFLYFAPEADLLSDARDKNEWAFINRLCDMYDEGMSVRAIAARVGISKSSAHRYLRFASVEAAPDDDVAEGEAPVQTHAAVEEIAPPENAESEESSDSSDVLPEQHMA